MGGAGRDWEQWGIGDWGGTGPLCPPVSPRSPTPPYIPNVPVDPHVPTCPPVSPCPRHTPLPLHIPHVPRSPPSASVSASGQRRMWPWGSCSLRWRSSMTTTSQVGGASMGGARGGDMSVQTPPSAPPSSALHRLLQRPPQEQHCGHPLLPESLRMRTRWAPHPPDPGDPPPKGLPTSWTSSPHSPGEPHAGFPPPHIFVGFKGAAGVRGGGGNSGVQETPGQCGDMGSWEMEEHGDMEDMERTCNQVSWCGGRRARVWGCPVDVRESC